MRSLVQIFVGAITCIVSLAAAAETTKFGMDARWIGKWQGEETVIRNNETLLLKKTLEIRAIEGTKDFRFALQYEGEPVREYTLKFVGPHASHYMIDERNGILLDTYIMHDSMVDQYDVNGRKFTNDTFLVGDSEMVTRGTAFGLAAIRKSGEAVAQGGIISYGLSTFYAGRLKKVFDP